MAKMLYDAVVAVDILCSLPEVDSQRLAAVGHSLGAKEVLYLAAFDERIGATVSSEGGIGTRFSNWEAPWYLGDEIRRESFTREHHELLSLVAPRAFLLLGGNSADGDRSWPFISAALQRVRAVRTCAACGPVQSRERPQRPARSRTADLRVAGGIRVTKAEVK